MSSQLLSQKIEQQIIHRFGKVVQVHQEFFSVKLSLWITPENSISRLAGFKI